MLEAIAAGEAVDLVGALLAFSRSKGAIVRADADARVQLLRVIQQSGRRGIAQSSAARALGTSDTTLCRLVDVLEASGLVSRVSHPTDRRVRMLHLTESGARQLGTCRSAASDQIRAALPDLSLDEQAVLRNLLRRLTNAPPQTKACQDCHLAGC